MVRINKFQDDSDEEEETGRNNRKSLSANTSRDRAGSSQHRDAHSSNDSDDNNKHHRGPGGPGGRRRPSASTGRNDDGSPRQTNSRHEIPHKNGRSDTMVGQDEAEAVPTRVRTLPRPQSRIETKERSATFVPRSAQPYERPPRSKSLASEGVEAVNYRDQNQNQNQNRRSNEWTKNGGMRKSKDSHDEEEHEDGGEDGKAGDLRGSGQSWTKSNAWAAAQADLGTPPRPRKRTDSEVGRRLRDEEREVESGSGRDNTDRRRPRGSALLDENYRPEKPKQSTAPISRHRRDQHDRYSRDEDLSTGKVVKGGRERKERDKEVSDEEDRNIANGEDEGEDENDFEEIDESGSNEPSQRASNKPLEDYATKRRGSEDDRGAQIGVSHVTFGNRPRGSSNETPDTMNKPGRVPADGMFHRVWNPPSLSGKAQPQEEELGEQSNNTAGTTAPSSSGQGKPSFVLVAHPRGLRCQHIQCTVLRDRTSMQGKLYPQYELVLEEPRRTLIIARKMSLNRTSNYHLFDMTRGQAGSKLSKKAGNYLGKLRAKNTNRTEYSLLSHKADKEEIAGISFDRVTLLGQLKDGNQPRKMKILVPVPCEVTGTVEGVSAQANYGVESLPDLLLEILDNRRAIPDGLMMMETKEPVLENGNYRLNFFGRVNLPSVKNFQIVHSSNIDNVLCQFGKVDEDVFHLDYKAPFNAVQAFALALCQFNL
eukprot:scaffold6861_cov248-Ochromonas_danica.AAC.7